MFDTIKEWLSNLMGGASEHASNAKQQLEDSGMSDKVSEVTGQVGEQAQNVKDQAADKVNELKDNFTSKQ